MPGNPNIIPPERLEILVSLIDALFQIENGLRGGKEYVIAELTCPPGSGKQCIVSLALASSNDPSVISPEDAILHLMLTRQFLRNTRHEREYGADIFRRINNRYQSEMQQKEETHLAHLSLIQERLSHLGISVPLDLFDKSPSPKRSRNHRLTLSLPTVPNDVRRYLEGPKSLLAYVPSVVVSSLDDGYAYVSVKSVMTLLLSMGLHLPHNTPDIDIDSSRSCYNKPAFKTLLSTHGLSPHRNILAISERTDGVDTGGSNKNNRGSLKVTTLTIESTDRTNRHTFPVAIGRDKADHSRYREILYTELKQLSKEHIYYDSLLKSQVPIRMFHYSTIADRPEIADCTGIGHHNGQLSSLPGISFPVVVSPPNSIRKTSATVKRYLSSCPQCYHARIMNVTNPSESSLSNPSCLLCCDWNPKLVEYKITKKTHKYPREEMPASGWLPATDVTFESIRSACRKAFGKMKNNDWSKTVGSGYMKTIAQLNDKVCSDVYEWAKWEDAGDSFDDECLPAKARSNATLELDSLIPGIMHLLFLGISKTILDLIIETLKKKRKYSDFHQMASSILKDIRSLSIEFCKAWAFGSMKTPGGPWVSENCLAFARVMKSIFSLLPQLLPQDGIVLKKCRKVVWSYVAIVARIMQEEYTPFLVDETDCFIKIFLSDLENLDAYNRGSTKNVPKVESTGNLIYLLRIPQMMRKFGPLRVFWEGSIRGEGIFRYLKPLVRRGVHNPGVPQALLAKYYSDFSLSWILDKSYKEDFDVPDGEDDEDMDDNNLFMTLSKRYTKVHTFRSLWHLQNRLEKGMAVSIIEYRGKFYAKCNIGTGPQLFSINHTPTSSRGIESFHLSVGPQIISGDLINNVSVDDPLYHPCIGLPLFNVHGVVTSFLVILASWKELYHNMQFQLPSLYTE